VTGVKSSHGSHHYDVCDGLMISKIATNDVLMPMMAFKKSFFKCYEQKTRLGKGWATDSVQPVSQYGVAENHQIDHQ